MKTTPLLMKGPLVLASMRGEKTQTRRLKGLDYYNKNPDQFELADKEGWLKAKPHCTKGSAPKGPIFRHRETGDLTSVPSPYGYKGDFIWIRENFGFQIKKDGCGGTGEFVVYQADNPNAIYCKAVCGRVLPIKWKSPLFMKRVYSRLTLKITDVRVEQLRNISEEDMVSEGCDFYPQRRNWFAFLWDSINKPCHSWATNPWVWVISYEAIAKNVDEVLK